MSKLKQKVDDKTYKSKYFLDLIKMGACFNKIRGDSNHKIAHIFLSGTTQYLCCI